MYYYARTSHLLGSSRKEVFTDLKTMIDAVIDSVFDNEAPK